MEVSFSPSFVKMFDQLPEALQQEVLEKIKLFKDSKNHRALKVHKLSGRLKDRYSFSVDYKNRIVFCYLATKPRKAYLLVIGDHDIYNN